MKTGSFFKNGLVLFAILLFATAAQARGKLQGIAVYSQPVTSAGINSTAKFTRVLSSATITVFAPTGTQNLATLYSDFAGTAKSNGFTAGADGSYAFYTDVASCDIRVSGITGVPNFTISDVPVAIGQTSFDVRTFGALCDGSTADTSSISAANTAAVAQGGSLYIPPSTTGCKVGTATLSAPIRSDGGSLLLTTGQTTTITSSLTIPPQIFFRNATAGLGTVSFTGNLAIKEIFPQWLGAIGNETTDDGAYLVATWTAAQTARIPIHLTRRFKTTLGLTLTKTVEVFGDGWATTGLIVASSVSTSTDIISVVPPTGTAASTWLGSASLDNRGYYFHDFGIYAESEPSILVDPYPAQPGRHALVFDVSTLNQFISNVTIERMYLGALSGRAIYFNNSNGAGAGRNQDGAWLFTIQNNIIRNGIKGDFWGDLIRVLDNTMVGENVAIESTQVTLGATSLIVKHNNITNRGGALLVHSGLALVIADNEFESYPIPSTGTGGALVNFDGDVQNINHVRFNGNQCNGNTTVPFDCVRANFVTTLDIDNNRFVVPVGKFAIKTTASLVNPIYGINTIVGAGTLTNSLDPLPVYRAYTIMSEPVISNPLTFIPNFFGVDKVYSKTLFVTSGTTAVGSTAGLGVNLFFDSDAQIAAGVYSASGGVGAGSLSSVNRDTAARLDMQFVGATGLLDFTNGVFINTQTVSPLFRSATAKILFQGTGSGATQLSATQTTPPTCSTNCGTSPSVLGTDTFMTVTMGGSGSPASGFVITFNGTWAAAPPCTVTMGTTGMAAGKLALTVVTTTTTITVVTNGTAPGNSDKYHVQCGGLQ